jgi:hypothetical protein
MASRSGCEPNGTHSQSTPSLATAAHIHQMLCKYFGVNGLVALTSSRKGFARRLEVFLAVQPPGPRPGSVPPNLAGFDPPVALLC